MKYLILLPLIWITGCNSVALTALEEDPWVLGDEVKVLGCEQWKKEKPDEYDC